MTITNLFPWISMKHGREEMRYRLVSDHEFFGDDLSESAPPEAIIVVLENPAYYLEEAEVLEMASAIKARMEMPVAGRLDDVVEELRQILRDLDTSQSKCEGCERTGYNDKTEGHSAQAIKAAITRLARAAVELRQAEEEE
jgi:hypothetical protein